MATQDEKKDTKKSFKGAKVDWPADMPDDMLEDTIQIAKKTLEEHDFETDGVKIAEIVKKHMDEGVTRKRCGFVGGTAPIREGAELYLKDGTRVGTVTSGTKGPTIGKAVGMAYVDVPHQKFKTELIAKVRGKDNPIVVSKMPFVPSNYYKKP